MLQPAAIAALRRLAGLASLAGLLLSAAVQVASFLGHDLARRLMFLHLGALLLALGVVLPGVRLQFDWRTLFAGAPRWTRRAVQLGFLYFALTLLALFVGDPGSPWRATGRARCFSAGWMVLYGICAVWYLRPARAAGGGS